MKGIGRIGRNMAMPWRLPKNTEKKYNKYMRSNSHSVAAFYMFYTYLFHCFFHTMDDICCTMQCTEAVTKESLFFTLLSTVFHGEKPQVLQLKLPCLQHSVFHLDFYVFFYCFWFCFSFNVEVLSELCGKA